MKRKYNIKLVLMLLIGIACNNTLIAQCDYNWSNQTIYNPSFTPVVYNNVTICIDGYVIIDGMFEFNYCDFIFTPNSKLVLEQRTKEFYACLFTTNEASVWDGIYLEPDGDLGVSFVECTIEHSANGITNSICRDLIVTACWFNHNYNQSIKVNGCSYLPLITINYNKVTSDPSQMKSPYQNLRAKNGFVFENNPVALGSLEIGPSNEFSILGAGIETKTSNISIKGNVFSQIDNANPSYYYKGGIYVNGESGISLYDVSIIDNSFYQSDHGIYSEKNVNLFIEKDQSGNVFTNNKTGLFYTGNVIGNVVINENYFIANSVQATYIYGIQANTNYGPPLLCTHESNITENTFTFSQTGGTNTAIVINENSANNAARYNIKENTMSLTRTGANFGILVNYTHLTNIEGNNITISNLPNYQWFFNSNAISLNYTHNAVVYFNNIYGNLAWTNATTRGIRMSNATQTLIRCNKIYDIAFGVSAFSNCTGTTLSVNRYDNHFRGLTLHSSGIIGQQAGNCPNTTGDRWFNFNFLQNATHTFTYNSNGGLSHIYNVNNHPIVLGGHTNGGVVFSRTYCSPAMANACPVSPIFPLSQQVFEEYQIEQLANTDNSIASFDETEQIWAQQQFLNIANNNPQILQDNAINTLYSTYNNLNVGKLDNVQRYIASNNLYDAAQLHSSIEPQNTIEKNSFELNSILLNNQSPGNDFSQLELDQIQQIAELCPFTDGEAVYRARSIISKYIPEMLTYVHPCEIHLNDEKKASFDFSASHKQICHVFPNPANDYINISWENIDEQTKAFVEIFCITGTKVLSLHMNTILQGNTVNVSSLQSGHYLYRITLPEVVFNGSFVIIR